MSSTAHHASLGRRTLEEIRQKRAADRLSKTSSGPDLTKVPTENSGIRKSESSNRLSETDVSGLVAQIRDLQKKNGELEEENNKLSLKLQPLEIDNEKLQKQLSEMEQNTVPSLRRALKDVAMEKDAAVISREDLSAQLRSLKKRLKEAEEEQYRAEEDATSLRAELNSVQQQAMTGTFAAMSTFGSSPDVIHRLEKELAEVRVQLQQELLLRKQEEQRFAEFQAHTTELMSEKQELVEKLRVVSASVPESNENSVQTTSRAFSLEDKEKLEKQMHEMAVMVERLESSRQKLLKEIDSQSGEIERLFEENSNLSSSCEETMSAAVHWENQVKECLKRNEELRETLGKLRSEKGLCLTDSSTVQLDDTNSSTSPTEVILLKDQLLKAQSRVEALSAEVLQVSAQLQQVTQAYKGLARTYKPVLRNIENSLIRMKQDGTATAIQSQ